MEAPRRFGRADEVRFGDGARPSAKPADPFFTYEPTHVALTLQHGALVSQLGNILLDLLSNQEGDLELIAPLKVRDVPGSKFSVKATVSSAGEPCCLKVKFYEDRGESRMYVADFQHRDGSASAFMRIFSMAVQSYQRERESSDAGLVVTAAPLMASPPAVAPEASQGSEALSLLSTAGIQEAEELQAEAARALARAARHPQQVESLCRALAHAELLLQSSSVAVALPLSQCFLALSGVPAAQGRLGSLRKALHHSGPECSVAKNLLMEAL